ncbi:HK97-gp10 family putative phage morphogenesis protein [Bacillus sp. Hm123]|uniref:HK97-gp10 family putative phage morphogenesis protein n=1 Tax=Bacillus sp. Hm123 TaxID=3450745 RepID=UPI003F430653
MLQLDGMEALLRQLNNVADSESVKEQALDKGAEHIRQKIAENTKRSDRGRGEHAADNVVVQRVGDTRLIGYAPDHFYMMFKELGTSKMSAEPVVAPTFEREIETAKQIMATEIRRALR